MWAARQLYATAAGLALLSVSLAEPFNISITDQSPTITYLPSRSGDSAQTWNSSYTISGSYNAQPGSRGLGDSLHYTTADNASASVGFVGTAVYVWGYNYGNDSDVQMRVGDVDLERGGEEGLLGWKTGLDNKWWEVTLNVTRGEGLFNGLDIRRITFTIDFGGQGATFDNTTLSALDENGNPNSQLSFSGSWTTGTEAGLVPITYNRVDTHGQDARILIPTLSGTSLVIIYGSVNDDHNSYFVDPSDPATGWPRMQSFNGSSPWIAIDQVIYFGVVEGGQIVAQNTAGGFWFDVSRIDFITASGGKYPSTNTAAIAGGVVGGVVGLALILGGIWFLWRKHIKKPALYKSGQSDGHSFEVDPYKETSHGEADGASPSQDDIEMTYLTTGSDHATNANARPYAAAAIPPLEQPTPAAVGSPSSSEPPAITPFVSETPASTANGTQRSHSGGERLALVSPELDAEEPIPMPTPATPAESSRKARRQQRAEAQAGFVQETDAGRVALLPPSYDPAWAQEGLPDHSSPTESPTRDDPLVEAQDEALSQSRPTAYTAEDRSNASRSGVEDRETDTAERDEGLESPLSQATHTNINPG